MRWARALFVLTALAACNSVHRKAPTASARPGSAAQLVPAHGVSSSTGAPASDAPRSHASSTACEATIAVLAGEPGLPGTPDLDARRAEIFARAKADGVLFVNAPVYAPENPDGDRMRRAILAATEPVKALYEAYSVLRKRPDLARTVFLTDGYVYSASPAFAAAIVTLVRPEDLFHESDIWVERGERILHAALHGADGYVYVDGPQTGEHVRLFLFDRVSKTREHLSNPLHRDAGALAAALGFDEMRLRHLSQNAVVVDLRYGDTWVPTVLDAAGAHLSVRCEAVPSGAEGAVDRQKSETKRRLAVVERLRAVIREQVEEALPFDEPKTEVGQQDGKLRQNWAWAYRFGRSEFDFNDDKYRVFDAQGRPRVPQVCIDFVTDTFERSSGSWYRPRGQPRERIAGRLDFSSLGIDNQRSVEHFVDFAKEHPEFFDVFELPPEERVPYAKRAEFFEGLASHRDRYRPGDVVTIFGLRSDGKLHYHSFIVYDSDPVSGAPSLVAANAGRPRIRPWESEMTSAPLRSIWARVRPRLEWLESVEVRAGEQADAVAAPKTGEPSAPAATAI